MKIRHGDGLTVYGPGVNIELTGDEVATAIDAYLVAHGVYVSGPRTISVNGELCEEGRIYVDPSGFVIYEGEKISGRGPDHTERADKAEARVRELELELAKTHAQLATLRDLDRE